MIHKTVKISTKINYDCAMNVTKVYLSYNLCMDNKQLLRVALKDWESCRGTSWQHYWGFLLLPLTLHYPSSRGLTGPGHHADTRAQSCQELEGEVSPQGRGRGQPGEGRGHHPQTSGAEIQVHHISRQGTAVKLLNAMDWSRNKKFELRISNNSLTAALPGKYSSSQDIRG